MNVRFKSKGICSGHRFSCGMAGFSLVEMLVVMAIVGVLSSLTVAGFGALFSEGFNGTVNGFSDTMEQARSYAMANNTYVYMGLKEVDSNDASAAPAAGNGVVVVAVAASTDGSNGFNGTSTWSGSTNLRAISTLKRFHGVHLSTTQLPTTGNLARPSSNPNFFLGSSACTATTTFSWPIGSASPNFTFTKVIRFGPSGDANVLLNATTEPTVDWIELGLQPMHGNAIASASTTNVSAIQIDGMTGAVRVYRP